MSDESPSFSAPRKPKICPSCGSARIASILYGYPGSDEKLRRDLDDGKIVLGGCCLTGNDPKWECVECGAQVFKARE